MVFKRVWDTSCPHVWDTWKADGVTWVEDDEEALQILLEHLCPDEHLNALSRSGRGRAYSYIFFYNQRMGFKRVWDSSCPRTWHSWVADGVTWVMRDLRPEDDEEAIRILVEHLCPDEVLCTLSDFMNDPASVSGIAEFWRGCLAERTSIGCYEEKDGNSKLVGLNVCVILCQGDDPDFVIKGKAWNNVYKAMKVCDKVDTFKLLGVNKLLYGLGLVVSREYRGHKLGSTILTAREPLALYHGVTAASTVFTGPASQKSAQRAGYSTALTVTLKELAEAGLDYPPDENRCIKLMVKNFT
ncbi:unnamed protein product [Arctia plantaginis]|uniref:N-acetyltransferase domain-containing protein n=1 Tax=Arctia plantaginis TaxID=874455 RepID=A0A8S0YPK2_ARCPL|nr:unnamed protein product [Arctia plantaginis]